MKNPKSLQTWSLHAVLLNLKSLDDVKQLVKLRLLLPSMEEFATECLKPLILRRKLRKKQVEWMRRRREMEDRIRQADAELYRMRKEGTGCLDEVFRVQSLKDKCRFEWKNVNGNVKQYGLLMDDAMVVFGSMLFWKVDKCVKYHQKLINK